MNNFAGSLATCGGSAWAPRSVTRPGSQAAVGWPEKL